MKPVRYSVTTRAEVRAHPDGWDIFGDLVSVVCVSRGTRIDAGELVVLDVSADDAGHAYVQGELAADACVVEYSIHGRGGRRAGAGRPRGSRGRPGSKGRKIRVTIQLDPSDAQALRAVAAAGSLSVSAYVRQLLLAAVR